MRFVKYQGLGNDFIIIDNFISPEPGFHPDMVEDLCRRGTGVGADGLILAEPPAASGDARMIIFNADGSEAEMCGNGIRCLAAFLSDKGYVASNPMHIETRAGVRAVEVLDRLDGGRMVEVDMGLPDFHRPSIPMKGEGSLAIGEPLEVDGKKLRATCLSMGNPHCVIFVDDVEEFPLEVMGPAIENHPFFPNRINVEIVQVIADDELLVRVWERGVGLTMACGTGACASFAAALAEDRIGKNVRVKLPGGILYIRLGEGGHIIMRGPVNEIYKATLSGEWIQASISRKRQPCIGSEGSIIF